MRARLRVSHQAQAEDAARVTAVDKLDEAVRAVHSAFGLDAQAAEAVVYGGTGR